MKAIKINTKKISSIKLLVAIGSLLLFPLISQANAGYEDDVNDVPVDGGLSLLVAAGTAYGVRRIRRKTQ